MRSSERVVIIVGLGLALAVMAGCVSWLVAVEILERESGWFAHAPNTGAVIDRDPTQDVAWAALWAAVIWLGAIITWVAISLNILRDPDPDDGPPARFLDRMRRRD